MVATCNWFIRSDLHLAESVTTVLLILHASKLASQQLEACGVLCQSLGLACRIDHPHRTTRPSNIDLSPGTCCRLYGFRMACSAFCRAARFRCTNAISSCSFFGSVMISFTCADAAPKLLISNQIRYSSFLCQYCIFLLHLCALSNIVFHKNNMLTANIR